MGMRVMSLARMLRNTSTVYMVKLAPHLYKYCKPFLSKEGKQKMDERKLYSSPLGEIHRKNGMCLAMKAFKQVLVEACIVR